MPARSEEKRGIFSEKEVPETEEWIIGRGIYQHDW